MACWPAFEPPRFLGSTGRTSTSQPDRSTSVARCRRLILGHEDLITTMRYAHLAPGSFTAEDLAAVGVDLIPPTGEIIPLKKKASPNWAQLGTVGHKGGLDVEREAM